MKSEVGVFKYRYMRRIAETTTFLQELKRLRDHMGRRIDTKALRIDYCEKLLGTSWSHAVSALPPGWMDNTIDHIIPIDCYDLNNETDLFKCFNFHNLQVLTLSENCAMQRVYLSYRRQSICKHSGHQSGTTHGLELTIG